MGSIGEGIAVSTHRGAEESTQGQNEAGKSSNYNDGAHFHPRWRKPGAAGLLGVSP
jgi:hypothetical protein